MLDVKLVLKLIELDAIPTYFYLMVVLQQKFSLISCVMVESVFSLLFTKMLWGPSIVVCFSHILQILN